MSRFTRLFIVLGLLLACLLPFSAPFLLPAHASSGTFTEYTYDGAAGSRPYYVYTPASYQVGTAVPLVVMLHGCGQTPADFAAGTQMNALADQKDFIVVYPEQTYLDNSLLCWNWDVYYDQYRGSGEPAIIAGIVQTVEQATSQWTIDPRRVYVAGLSAGAAMAVIMATTYPDIFAAMGSASGLEYQAATSPLTAGTAMMWGGPDPVLQGQDAYDSMGSAARSVPTIVFQGKATIRSIPSMATRLCSNGWKQTTSLPALTTPASPVPRQRSTVRYRVETPIPCKPGMTAMVMRWRSTGRSTTWGMPGPVAVAQARTPIQAVRAQRMPCTIFS